jgi:hypothetical protein
MKLYWKILILVITFVISLAISFNVLSDSSDGWVINNDEPCTTKRKVKLPSMHLYYASSQGQFRVSEDPSFTDVDWRIQFQPGPWLYTLSEGYGLKTVYIEKRYYFRATKPGQEFGWITSTHKDNIFYVKDKQGCYEFLKRNPQPQRMHINPPQR